MSIDSKSGYSKAYYNMRKRRSVNTTYEALTPELAKFMVNEGNPRDFAELYDNNMEYLTTVANMSYKERKTLIFVVREKYGNIIGYSRMCKGKPRILIGNTLSEMEFSAEQLFTMTNNNIDISVLDKKYEQTI